MNKPLPRDQTVAAMRLPMEIARIRHLVAELSAPGASAAGHTEAERQLVAELLSDIADTIESETRAPRSGES
jgi:hypothetical protein